MSRLIKYVMIVNLILIVLGGTTILLGALNENYRSKYASQIQVDGDNMTFPDLVEPRQTLMHMTGSALALCMFWGFPIFVLLMSGLYLYKNPCVKEYGKSLLIPTSYCLLSLIISIVWFKTIVQGEEAMAALFVWVQLAITFTLVVIVNSVILFTKK